jgi:hypothetical protein
MTRVLAMVMLMVAALAAPLAVEAQQAGKGYRIGVLSVGPPPIPPDPPQGSLVEALRELGYAEGRNVAFYWRWASRLSTQPHGVGSVG